MAIPKEILAIQRPKNTVVVCYGKNKDKYAVRQRIGCKRKNGKSYPVNGPTIGHLVGGKYVPIEEKSEIEKVLDSEVDIKDWGNVMACEKAFHGILDELEKVYNPQDARKLYCIALLRVMYPGIKDCQLKEHYEDSWLSELYPNVGLSKNTVSSFLKDVGKSYSKIVQFMRNRVESLGFNANLLIDGTLKTCKSKINSLSDFSRKSKVKGNKNISVIYSFDLDRMEPVTAKCYPGNMTDTTAYSDFVKEFEIKNGFIVGDKAFTRNAVKQYLENHPGLHVLYPLKRNASQIKTYKMYEFDKILPGFEGVTFKKVAYKSKSGDCYYLYAFRDVKKAAQEERDWLRRAKKNEDYSFEALEEKRPSFGTILLDSDLDLAPEVAYKAYLERWIIEIVMRYYKSALDFTDTREHSDYSVIGSEFVDFLSVICTFRLLKNFDKAGLLQNKTYKQVMSVLKRAKKVRPDSEGWCFNKLNPSQADMLVKLGLIPKQNDEPKKRGRPKGSKNKVKKE